MTAAPRDRIQEALLAELAPALDKRGIERGVVDGSFDLFGTGLLDSLAFVDLLLGVETRLGLEFEVERMELDRLTSLDALVAELDRIRAEDAG